MNPVKQIQAQEKLYFKSKSIGVDFFKAYKNQNVEEMLALCSSDCEVSFIPMGEAGKGHVHQVGKAIWTALIDSFPSINNTVNSINIRDGKVYCDVTIRGQQSKDFGALKSKGNEFEEGHIFIFKINENDKVEDLSVNWNHESLVEQLTK